MARTLIFGAVALALLTVPSSATATTIVGDDLTHVPEASSPGSIIAPARKVDGSGANDPGFASGGILTSVSVKTQGSAGSVGVYLLRKTAEPGPGTVTFLSLSPSIAVDVPAVADPAGQITTVLTRRPVSAGDRFGMLADTSAGIKGYWIHYAAEFDYCFYSAVPHADGIGKNYFSPLCNNHMPLVGGVVEEDADGDGYGDETQDACPAESARQAAPCSADIGSFVVSSRKIGRDGSRRRVTYEVRNLGPSPATNIVLRITKPSFVGSIAVSGCTLAADRRMCTIPALVAGATQTIQITARSKRGRGLSKRRNLSLRVMSLDQTDANATNNDAVFALRLKMRKR